MLTTTQIDNRVAESLFHILDQGKKKSITSDRFLEQLSRMGILTDDPRIQDLLQNFDAKERERRKSPTISASEFNEILKQNALVKKSLTWLVNYNKQGTMRLCGTVRMPTEI